MKASRIIIWFYGVFAALVAFGKIFIDYEPLHLTTILVVACFILCLLLGSLFGERRGGFETQGLSSERADKWLLWLGIGTGISTILIWFAKLTKYGSLDTFLANAYTIREGTIGRGDPTDLPIYVQYFNSLVYALFAIALCRFGQTRQFKYVLISAYFFVLIVMNDLTQLGRIGILYAIFCVIGYFIVFRRRAFTPINIFCVVALFALLMLPRLIRGSFDNFEASIRNYRDYFSTDIPPVFNALTITYIYYFSSPYALDNYLQTPDPKHTYGERTFTPFVNIAARLTGDTRQTTIDEPAYIPFRYNIYTVIKDFYQDFGMVGFTLVPFLIGIVFGRLFVSASTFDALKIFSAGWLFYTPIYNAYSFGGFMISFALLVALNARTVPRPHLEAVSTPS